MKIPGCHPRALSDPAVQSTGEVTCDVGPVTNGLPQMTVWLATFMSASLERSWLVSVGNGDTLAPGVCVQGSGWAADIVSGMPGTSTTAELIRAGHDAGGRVVSTGACY